MPSKLRIRVNNRQQTVGAAPDTPLLYVLTNELALRGPRFGCGMQEYVFAPNNPSTFGNVAHLVRKSLTEYEPRVDVLDVQVETPAGEQNKVLIRVDYRIRSTNSYHNLVYPFFVQEGPGE